MTDPDLADRLRRACDERVQQRIADAVRRRAEQRALREQFARRRRAGLEARRLARLRTGDPSKNHQLNGVVMREPRDFDDKLLSALVDVLRAAIDRQSPHVRDQLLAALTHGDTSLRLSGEGISVEADGRQVALVPWTAIDVR